MLTPLRFWFGLGAFVCLSAFANIAQAQSFTVPYDGNLYLQCIGGSAAATSEFGIGSSPSNFVPYLTGLPAACPDSQVLVGPVSAGTTVEFGISTLWLGQTYWAFSGNTDEASIVAFTDVCDTLGMNGKITQQTSANTWVMHLNDAAHYTISQCEANNILVQITLINTCTQQSLSGTYTYVLTGSKYKTGAGFGEFNAGPRSGEHAFSAVGQLVADGQGNFTGTDTVSDAGVITKVRNYTGTYTVNTNCTGSATSSVFGDMNFVITNNLQNVNFIQTDHGTNVVGTAQQQFH